IQKGTEDFNLDKLSLTDNSMDDVLSGAYTLPMMADKRLIIVRDAEKMKEKSQKEFLSYAESPAETSCIVFISNKEKTDMRLKFFTQFKKKGEILNFKPLYENKLPYFINSEVKRMKKRINDDAINALIRLVGNNLFEIDAELKKIAIAIGDKEMIALKDVEEHSTDARRSTVFELADFLATKDLASSFKVLKKLNEQGEYPTMILGAVIRHFNNLFQVKELLGKKEGKDSIAKAIRIHPYFLNKYITQSKRFKKSDLKRVFAQLLTTDIALKSRKMPDKLILENLFFELCLG
ncbi:DNA polymerase III subunit delta, partial [Thermodesulfobacteriota bacterium]